jgi:carboxyl-terminal processing protease
MQKNQHQTAWATVSRRFFVVASLIVFVGGVVAGRFITVTSDGSISHSTAENLDYASVEEAYDTLRGSFDGQLDTTKLTDGLKTGLAEATGDPYTEYFSAEESREFSEQLSGTFSGIGAELGKENNAIVIIAPLKGFPAEKAGLRSKDIIVKIDDQDALSLSISEAVKKIRGEKGTTVKLTVLRGAEQRDFSIVRDDITVPSVDSEILEGGVCSLRISRFAEDTDRLVSDAARQCKAAETTLVLLDLRNNPGGYLDQAVKVSSHWLNAGQVVVSEKRGDTVVNTHKAAGGAQEFKGFKTVVLINEGSASASEIVAGALKDYGAATLVGTKTFGKGSVQEIDKLEGGSSIKITIARWFTPKDKNIDKEGIEPDTKLELSAEQISATQTNSTLDPQKQKALELLR